MSLMAQVDRARSQLQAANEQLSEARELLGLPKQETPKEPEEKGLFDRVKDAVSNVSLSDVGHTVLDIAGLVPVLGAPADGINAVWYAAEGDWVNAGLSAAGMIPIAGEAATAAKLGNRAVDAVRTADNAMDATRGADNAIDAANSVETAAGASRSADEAPAPSTSGGSGGDKPPTDNPPPNKGGFNDEDPEDPFNKYDDYAEQYGYGDDYRDSRERNYGDMGRNQRENSQFDAAQREAERRAGREFDRDERQDRHHRDPHNDGKYRTYEDIVDDFDE